MEKDVKTADRNQDKQELRCQDEIKISSINSLSETKRSIKSWKIFTIIIKIIFFLYICGSIYLYWHLSRNHIEEQSALNKSYEKVKEQEAAIAKCDANIKTLTTIKMEKEERLSVCKEQHQTCETTSKRLETSNRQLQKKTETLEQQNNNLTYRLSEIMGNNAVEDNDGISKMDDSSPIKIAEQFREIYDNEFTDAYEELEHKHNHSDMYQLTKELLNILQLANNLCINYSRQHLDSIKQSITSLRIDIPVISVKENCSQKAIEVNEGPSHRLGWKEMFYKICINEEHTPLIKLNPSCNSQPITYSATKTKKLEINEDSFSTKEWRQVFDIWRKAAYKMQDSLMQALLDIVIKQFEIQQESSPRIISYIRKYLHLCWMMNMREKPIFADFIEVKDKTVFNTSIFEAFMTSGQYLDYVVWPPLYRHNGGPLLAKGFAEGRG